MREVDRLRAEVARAQRLAGDKMRRVQKGTGAVVRGTQFDPTRDAAKVARYNSKQLRSYLSQLDSFRDRSVQFVGGAKGAPIPQADWNRFASVQATYNRIAAGDLESVANVTLRGGQTIAQRENTFLPETHGARGRSANRPLGEIRTDSFQVASDSALAKLEAGLRKRMSASYKREKLGNQRLELAAMMDRVGESALKSRISELSDKQFNALWNYTDFADFISTRYEALKRMSVAEESHVADEFRGEVIETFKWAKNIR